MLPRAQRLRTNTEILTTFRRGEKIRRGFLTAHFLPGTTPKATVIVDTKLSKRAVVRNHLKRQLRALLEEAGLPQGQTIFRAYPGLEKLSFQNLRSLVQQCLSHQAFHQNKRS